MIDEWFYQELVGAIARRFPDCLILLVGADSVNAEDLWNVKFIEEVPLAELPYCFYGLDVCMLPPSVVPLTLVTNIVKLYRYLSAGKTAMSVVLHELQQFGELTRLAADITRFVYAIVHFLDRSAAVVEINIRQAFAQEQNHKHRAKALIDSVETQFTEPFISVVVATYTNPDMTKACLFSLDEYSYYTMLELIVVANASVDGPREFLA